MTSHNVERLRAHQNNICRYRRLLATHLTDLERAYIERRLNEEQTSVETLLQKEFSDRLSARLADRSANGPATNLDMTALLHPADAFSHPMDVVEDCDLTSYEKRAILSSWAADACAVKDLRDPSRSFRGLPSASMTSWMLCALWIRNRSYRLNPGLDQAALAGKKLETLTPRCDVSSQR